MKKNLKKGFLSVLVLIIALSAFCACDKAKNKDEETEVQVLQYTFDETSETYSVTSCDKSATVVEIPSQYRGYDVTSIGDRAFENCNNLTSVTIGDKVEKIGSHAFYACGSLTSVKIPSRTEFIGDHAFFLCDHLSRIVFSGSKKTWGNVRKELDWRKYAGNLTDAGSVQVFCWDGIA